MKLDLEIGISKTERRDDDARYKFCISQCPIMIQGDQMKLMKKSKKF